MSFLRNLGQYKNICLQCHDNPDADSIAAAFGLYCYFVQQGCRPTMIYGGEEKIKKRNLLWLISECKIPIEHRTAPIFADILVAVDCQFTNLNVTSFAAERTAVIDHHVVNTPPYENVVIWDTYQSCSPMVWQILTEEGFDLSSAPSHTGSAHA